MYKKLFVVLASISLLLVACSKEEEKNNKEKAPVEDKVNKVINPVLNEDEMKEVALKEFSEKYPNFSDVSVKEISITQDFEVPGKKELYDVYGVSFTYTLPTKEKEYKSEEEEKEHTLGLNKDEQRVIFMKSNEVIHFYDVNTSKFLYETISIDEDVLDEIDHSNQESHKEEISKEEAKESNNDK